jgi:hypothetical protein
MFASFELLSPLNIVNAHQQANTSNMPYFAFTHWTGNDCPGWNVLYFVLGGWHVMTVPFPLFRCDDTKEALEWFVRRGQQMRSFRCRNQLQAERLSAAVKSLGTGLQDELRDLVLEYRDGCPKLKFIAPSGPTKPGCFPKSVKGALPPRIVQRPMRCLLALTAARASRSASRRRSVSRLSQSCLPLATASSHLTRPFLK